MGDVCTETAQNLQKIGRDKWSGGSDAMIVQISCNLLQNGVSGQ